MCFIVFTCRTWRIFVVLTLNKERFKIRFFCLSGDPVTLLICVSFFFWVRFPADHGLVGAVGVPGEPAASARSLQPGHLSAAEGLQ